MKTANSRIICSGEFDKQSILRAYALVPCEQLKSVAQTLREKIDWYGRKEYGIFYDCIMEVIHVVEPKFETEFTPAI